MVTELKYLSSGKRLGELEFFSLEGGFEVT